MERVKKGEKYWFIDFSGMTYVVDWLTEFYDEENTTHFLTKNYFHTEEEAESMARKLRAVLNGADVIEMPSEEEIKNKASEMCCIGGCDHSCEDTHFCGLAFPRERSIKMAYWLKSKIVK